MRYVSTRYLDWFADLHSDRSNHSSTVHIVCFVHVASHSASHTVNCAIDDCGGVEMVEFHVYWLIDGEMLRKWLSFRR